MNSNLRILCISPIFVPQANPEAFCGGKIVQALIENHIDILVLYMGNKKISLDTSKKWEKLKDHTFCLAEHEQRDILKSVYLGVRYHTISWSRWVNAVINAAVKLNHEKPFDVVYSRSLPMHAHIAGYWCAKKMNIPWIVNINDPWEFHLFPIYYDMKVSWVQKYMSRMWLRRTLKNAFLVTYPCKRLKSFHENLSKIDHYSEIIPHVGNKSDDQTKISGKFRLVHAGLVSAKKSLRFPTTFFKGVSIFLKNNPNARNITELLLVGPEDKANESILSGLKLETIIKYTGIVNYEDSLAYIGSASVCVLIEAKMNEGIFLPSKLIDYIVSKKPIIAISPSNGTVNDYLPDSGIIRVDQDDTNGVARAVTEYYKHFCSGTLKERTPSNKLINEFTPDSVAKKFLSIVCKAKE